MDFDQFVVTGKATLNGALAVGWTQSFQPYPGDVYTVMKFGSRGGNFTTLNGLPSSPEVTLQVNLSATELRLEATGNATNLPVRIKRQPADRSALPGSQVTLDVEATGALPLAYQWRKNGVNLEGASNETYTISAARVSDGGSYTVVVSNDAGIVESEPAQLTMLLSPLPFNDQFALRGSIAGTSGAGKGNNAEAVAEAGEPPHGGKPGSKSVWLTWKAPASGIVTFTTAGSSFDTLLAVYTGDAVNKLTEVASDEDRGGFLTSLVRFNAVAGTDYQIAADGYFGANGDVALSWDLEVTPQVLPVITRDRQPQSLTVAPGSDAIFSVTVEGAGLTYQWFFNGQALTGATAATLRVPNAQDEQTGLYFARVSNVQGQSVDSWPASLQLGLDPRAHATDKLRDLRLDPARPGGLGLQSHRQREPNSFVSPVAGLPGTQVLNNYGSTTEPKEPIRCVLGGASQWMDIRPQDDGFLVVDTIGSAIDTLLIVIADDDFGAVLGCDDNEAPDGVRSQLKIPVLKGQQYIVKADGVRGATGIIKINWRLEPAVDPAAGPTIPALKDGRFSFRRRVPAGRYQIEATENFLDWGVISVTNITTGDLEYLETEAATGRPLRFYRTLKK